MKKKSFPIVGMHCASCAKLTERSLSKTPGVTASSVNYASETATVEYDDTRVRDESLSSAVAGAGYKAIILPEGEGKSADDMKEEEKMQVAR